jgi:hypothetical protein
MHQHHSGAWDEKSVGDDGANLVTEGIMVGLCQPIPA